MANLASVFRTDTPAGGADPREGDDRIREVKAAIRERLQHGGMFIEDSGTIDQDAGKIMAGIQVANRLTFFESDKPAPTEMLDFNDSTSLMKVGTGRGGGANSWIFEAQTGNFENIDVAGTMTAVTAIAIPAKSVVNVNQGVTTFTKDLTASYQTLQEQATFTTAATAGDVLVIWCGTYLFDPTNANDSARIDFKLRRSLGGTPTDLQEFLIHIEITAAVNLEETQMPVTLCFLDTTAPDAGLVTYDVQAKHDYTGTPGANGSQMRGTRTLTTQEFIFN